MPSDALSLKQRITEAVKTAMKAREKVLLGTLRLLTSEIKRVEVDTRQELDDMGVVNVIRKMIKQRKDSATQFKSAGRVDLEQIELAEIEVLKQYLPEELSRDAILVIIEKAIQEAGATSAKEMGKVMALVRPQVDGRVDMQIVSGLIKEKLG